MDTRQQKTMGSILALMIILTIIFFVSVSAEAAPIPTSTAPPQILKVGNMLTLNRPHGVEPKKMFDIIFPAFNDEGGVAVKGQRYHINLITYDDKATAEAGRAAAERMIFQDKVKFIIGGTWGAAISASLPITEPEKIPFFAGSSSDKLVDPAFKYVAGSSWARTGTAVNQGNLFKTNPKLKTLVGVGLDTQTGHDQAQMEDKVDKAYGVNVLSRLFVPDGATEFAPVATKIMSLKPDVVTFAATGGTQLGLFLKELHRAGYKGYRYIGTTINFSEVLGIAGKEPMEGVIANYSDTTEVKPPSPIALKVRKAYEAKYGEWNNMGLLWVNCLYLLKAAVEKANSLDPDAVMEALEGLEFDGTLGRCKMVKRPDLGQNKAREMVATTQLYQIKDGKPVPGDIIPIKDAIEALEKIFGGKWD